MRGPPPRGYLLGRPQVGAEKGRTAEEIYRDPERCWEVARFLRR